MLAAHAGWARQNAASSSVEERREGTVRRGNDAEREWRRKGAVEQIVANAKRHRKEGEKDRDRSTETRERFAEGRAVK